MTTRGGGFVVVVLAALVGAAPAVHAQADAPAPAADRLDDEPPPASEPTPAAPEGATPSQADSSAESLPSETPSADGTPAEGTSTDGTPAEGTPPYATSPEGAAVAPPATQPALSVPEPAIPAVPEVPPLVPAERAGPPYFEPGSAGYYALWYGPEWALVAVLGASELFQPFDLLPPGPALIGPTFDDDDPDPALLADPRLDDVIGRPFLREKVPPWTVAAIGLSGLAGAGVIDVIRHGELHHTHNLVLGGLTAIAMTQLTTNVLKASFGRLRPDFRDRYRHASCQGLAPRSPVVDCDEVRAGGFELPDDEYLEGYRSFPSGHASSTFAFATYLSLWLGSELVWAEDAGAIEASLGSLGIGALYAGALYTAATRLSDNRHHPEDVAVGAALGASIAAASWFLHFDLAGNARWRGVEIAPGPGDAGLALVGRF